MKISIVGLFLLCGIVIAGKAQSKFDPYQAFAPVFYPDYGDNSRAADGSPGPGYWQNAADYRIDARLDAVNHAISGRVTIAYTNNSPQKLGYIWLQMDQDIYKKDSRGIAWTDTSGGRYASGTFVGGYHIHSIVSSGKALKYIVTDTRMKVFLPAGILPKGGKLVFTINYDYAIPEHGSDRTGMLDTKNGRIYEIAQWYPRLCVYDNISGWNTLPYLGQGEFYLDYGNITYNLTLPVGMIAVGSGELLNPQEVLTKAQYQNFGKAKRSESTVMLRTAQEVNDNHKTGKTTKIWKFACKNTRDATWAASAAFIWDAAKIDLPGGRSALAMSVYPEESAKDTAWKRSTQMVKGSVEFYSRYLYPYTYPVATNVAGIVTGMEYPGIVFCSSKMAKRELWETTSHEFGHNWFPMLVGSNERKYPWMDEGFNTFINELADKDFNHAEFNKPDDLSAEGPYLYYGQLGPVMTEADVQQPWYLGQLAYNKPAVGLRLLREQILGKERFDQAFKDYVHAWVYKHPTPYDFFHCMENSSGETLDWFWRGWFLNVWQLDQAVKEVKYIPGKGNFVTIENLGELPMPVTVEITEEDGDTERINLPVEIWQHGAVWTFAVPAANKIIGVAIDPDHQLPDMNRKNNNWIAGKTN